jgi:membrane protease YdiL (CAAX protease family)
MLATYGLLFAAFAALYAPDIPLGRDRQLSPWQVVFSAALVSGLVAGLLDWLAATALVLLWLVAAAHRSRETTVPGVYWKLAAVALAIALALHLIPGFQLVVVASDVRLTPQSASMTLKANFDKGAAGLLLLAYFTNRPTLPEWPRVTAIGLAFGLATGAVVIGVVLAFGAIRIDPKLPALALQWMPINLLLTCVFEEVLFRGLVQQSIADAVRGRPQWRWLPIAVASVLFGLAHAGGGVALIVGASLAGVGYGLAYARAARVEAAVLAHFTLNATHFFLFTYPYAAR